MKIAVVCDVLGLENSETTIAAMQLTRSQREKRHTVRIACSDAEHAGQLNRCAPREENEERP